MASGRLLVVDDESQVRRLFEDYLSSLGYEVVTAENGRVAFDHCMNGQFDCVLCDLIMPEMDGNEFLQEFRKTDPQTPFFLMTGFPSIESAVSAVKHGAYDYLTKPLNMEDVSMRIERAIHQRSLERSLRKANTAVWAMLISVPLWLVLGVLTGIVWKQP